MIEKWKDVLGYEGFYQVSNLGRVRSLDRHILQVNRWGHPHYCYKKGTILKPKLERSDRYLRVSLWQDGHRYLKYVHRLVAEAFLDNPNTLPEVNHIDENKCNNCVSNLEWCDRQYNATYGKLKDHYKGLNNPSVKLTEDDIRVIRQMIANGLSDSEISRNFGVTTSNINCIRNGKTWRWVL